LEASFTVSAGSFVKKFVLAALALFATNTFSEESAPDSLPAIRLSSGVYMRVGKDFRFPGEYFYFKDGKVHLTEKDQNRPKDSCTFAVPYKISPERDEVVYPKGLRKGQILVVGTDGFQVTCTGTERKVPTVGDVRRHFGGLFNEPSVSDANVKRGTAGSGTPAKSQRARGSVGRDTR